MLPETPRPGEQPSDERAPLITPRKTPLTPEQKAKMDAGLHQTLEELDNSINNNHFRGEGSNSFSQPAGTGR